MPRSEIEKARRALVDEVFDERNRLRAENAELRQERDAMLRRAESAESDWQQVEAALRSEKVVSQEHWDFYQKSAADIADLLEVNAGLEKTNNAYATAARVIALHLQAFNDETLSYDQMIAESSRRAARRIAELEAENAAMRNTPAQKIVAELAATDAVIRHLWDIAAFCEPTECNAFRDPIHILNKITRPAIRDLVEPPAAVRTEAIVEAQEPVMAPDAVAAVQRDFDEFVGRRHMAVPDHIWRMIKSIADGDGEYSRVSKSCREEARRLLDRHISDAEG